jgi:hypothetical protein
MVCADVPHADVITHDHENVGFLGLRHARVAAEGRRNKQNAKQLPYPPDTASANFHYDLSLRNAEIAAGSSYSARDRSSARFALLSLIIGPVDGTGGRGGPKTDYTPILLAKEKTRS